MDGDGQRGVFFLTYYGRHIWYSLHIHFSLSHIHHDAPSAASGLVLFCIIYRYRQTTVLCSGYSFCPTNYT